MRRLPVPVTKAGGSARYSVDVDRDLSAAVREDIFARFSIPLSRIFRSRFKVLLHAFTHALAHPSADSFLI